MILIHNFYIMAIINSVFPSATRGKWHYKNNIGSFTEAVYIRPLKSL